MRSLVAIGLLLALPARPVAADEAVVAVLPLAAGEAHGLYAKPVADELARQLRSRASVAAESLSLAGSVPARVALVVDGRIVDAGRRKVSLEARVRDPRTGAVVVAAMATKARAVGEIDVMAAELAGMLAPRLVKAIEEQREAGRGARDEGRGARGEGKRDGAEGKGTAETNGHAHGHGHEDGAVDQRPVMLVLRAKAQGSDAELLTRHGMWLAHRLGHRAVLAGFDAGVDPIRLPELMKGAGAVYAVGIELRGVTFHKVGVLTARGRARVVLYDRSGRPLFDQVARTDTVVGSRGDGPAALVHFIGDQIVDVVYPYFKKLVR